MKPSTRKCTARESSKVKPTCKRKRNRMKSSDNRIPRKRVAIHDDESNKDGELSYTVEARDENNPLDMWKAMPVPSEISVASNRDCIKVDALKIKSMLSSNTLSTGNASQLNQLSDNTPCSKVVDRNDNITKSIQWFENEFKIRSTWITESS